MCTYRVGNSLQKLTSLAWTSVHPVWASDSMHFFFFFFSFQHHEHHLGAIRAPTCQCSLSVTKVADLLRVGLFSWSELSKIATFLVCLKKKKKGKVGQVPRQQLRPTRDAAMFRRLRNYSLLYVITVRKYFLFFFFFFSHYQLKWPGSYGD